MALADATVRVILDVSRFDRDLQTKVASAARRAGRTFETEFTRTARSTGARWAQEFQGQASQSMSSAGTRTGRTYGLAVRNSARGTGRLTGRDLGEQIRGGLVSTATLTGRQYGRGLLSGSITDAGARIGMQLGRTISNNVNVQGVGTRLRQAVQADAEPNVLAAARTIAKNFGSALSGALGALSIGRTGLLATAVTGLVSEGTQLAAAVAPALQAIGLIPAVVTVAAASVATLVVAFQGMGDAFKAAASGDAEKLGEAMTNLAPAARSVVVEFGKLSPRLRELRMEVQQAFFRELEGDLTRLGDVLVGPVQRGMVQTASAAGRMASGLAGVLTQSRNATVIEQIFNSAAAAFDRMTAPMQTFTQGLLDWTRATLPAFDQLVVSLGSLTERFGAFMSRASASGEAVAWVNEAITTISQLGRIVGSTGRLLGTLFSAANEAGGQYLLNLNNALIATRQFLAVGEGRTALLGIFEGLHQVVQALAAPLRAAVVALGQISRVAGTVAQSLSQGVADAIRGIGEGIANAGPGLTRFASAVGSALSEVGAVLPSIGASLGRLLTALAPLASVFGVVARAAAALLEVISSLPTGLLTVIAAFVGLRALGVPAMFTAIGTQANALRGSFTSAGGALNTLTSTYQTNLASLTAMRIQQQAAQNAMAAGIPTVGAFGTAVGGLADRARAAGQAIGGPLMAGARGLLGLLGGPVGLLLTAASVAIGLWANEQQKADQAVQEHNARVQQLTATLDKATGSITSATLAQAQQTFSQGAVADAARRLSLNISLVGDAATGNEGAMRRLQTELRNSAKGAIQAAGDMGTLEMQAKNLGVPVDTLVDSFLGNAQAMATVRAAAEGTSARFESLDAIWQDIIPDQIAVGREANSTAESMRKQADAIREANAAYSPSQRLAQSLADAMGVLATNSSSAADKTRALDTALRLLNGGTLELSDAMKNSADAVANGSNRLTELIDKYAIAGKTAADLGITTAEYTARQKDLGQALFDSSGQVDFASERARGLYDVSKDLRQATIDQTAAIVDNAQKTGGDLTAAHQRAQDVMARAREQVIQWAQALGYSEADAARFADALGLIPENVRISLTMQNVPQILQQLAEVKGRIDLMPDRKSLRLDSNAAPMRKELERLGFTVEDIPGSKDIKITPNTAAAGTAMREFIEQQIEGRNPRFNVGANIDLGKASAEELRAFIQSLPVNFTPGVNGTAARSQIGTLLETLIPAGQPTVTPGLNGAPVVTNLKDLLLGVIQPGQPQITPGVNPGPAETGLDRLLDGLPGGLPVVTPGVNPGPARQQLDALLNELLTPGQPTVTPGVNPDPAKRQLNELGLPLPLGTPQVTPSANIAPAREQIGGLITIINQTQTSGPIVNANVAPADAQFAGLVTRINTTTGSVNVGANTGGAYGAVGSLVGWISSNGSSIGVGADTRAAFAQVDALVRYINSRVATVEVRSSNPGLQAAQGGVFKYFAGGGFNSMRSMPANRAEIVPPKTMRVIGDRARGDEAFIPLINTARSHALLKIAANRLDRDVVPRNERPVTTNTTTFEPGSVVVNAPYSDPRLVARAVVNELTREAVN